jgi:hypothetical protein
LPELNKREFMLPADVLGCTYSGVILQRILLKTRSRVLLEDQIVAGRMMKFLCFYKSEISCFAFTEDSVIDIT